MKGARPLGWVAAGATGAAAAAIGAWIAQPRAVASPDRDPGAAISATLADAPTPVVTSLRSGGAGERAGLRVGDRIEAVGGRPTPSLRMLRADLRFLPAGPVDIRVRRGDGVRHAVLTRSEKAD